MSFDDYANHIYQKHRLAVAISIIKSKPTNVQTIQYLEELKSKIDHKMDDDDVTVCSDDFLMNDDEMNDSVTILKDFDLDNVVCNENVFEDFDVATEEVDVNSEKPQEEENISQITYFDSQLTPEIVDTDVNNTNSMKDCSNKNRDIPIDTNTKNLCDQNKDYNDHINYSDHNYSKAYKNTAIDSQSTKNTDRTYYDSQKTIPYTVHGFTQNFTHFSESQNALVIPSKYIYGTNKSTVIQNNDKNKESSNTETENIKDFEKSCKSVDKIYENQQIDEPFGCSQTMNMFHQNNDDDFDEIRNEFSQTVVEINNGNDKTAKDMNKNPEIAINYSQNFDEYFDEIRSVDDFRHSFNTGNNTAEMDTHYNSLEYNQNTDNLRTNNNETTSKNNDFEKQFFTPNSEKHSQLCTDASEIEKSNKLCVVTSEHERTISEEHESEEIISYKVLKEFNKVKMFLNKPNRRMSCDGYSTDSGYRSDSQIRSSRGSLQLSGNWLNQSGCCLFNYIMTCPLVESTREITNEIAEVLSQLIEKLHEDEKYPSFLEEILEAVDLLIRQVYEGIDNGDNEFLKKDEYIQRILLLNKSFHIQQHTIENISKILEKFHSKVTEPDSTYELTNIDEIENISYIFYILEILIKKYLRNKQIASQNSISQSQDDEKHLKKSSITDIWRKKWNPSQKVFEGTREKKCVLKNCSEILNKLVVECVSNYSLVAYSALKCFNSMQS